VFYVITIDLLKSPKWKKITQSGRPVCGCQLLRYPIPIVYTAETFCRKNHTIRLLDVGFLRLEAICQSLFNFKSLHTRSKGKGIIRGRGHVVLLVWLHQCWWTLRRLFFDGNFSAGIAKKSSFKILTNLESTKFLHVYVVSKNSSCHDTIES
jgi:hypothetical protein